MVEECTVIIRALRRRSHCRKRRRVGRSPPHGFRWRCRWRLAGARPLGSGVASLRRAGPPLGNRTVRLNSLLRASEPHPDTEFERGRGVCRRYIAPPRNQPYDLDNFEVLSFSVTPYFLLILDLLGA